MSPTVAFASSRHRPATRPIGRLLALLSLGHSRRRLGELDDHLLRDLGLTRHQARTEAERSVWDAPDHWLR